MAEATATPTEAPVVAGDATPSEETALVVTKNIGNKIWGDGSSALPIIKEDMPLDQRKDAIRTSLKATAQIKGKVNIATGELLYEVSKNKYYKEWTFQDDTGEVRNYKDFEEFCETELNMKKRKAYYLVSNYETFVVKLGIPIEVLKDIDWTKATALEPVLTDENWVDLLEKSKDMSVRDVKKMVDELKAAEKPAGTAKDKTDTTARLSFACTPEQHENIQNALKVAQTMSGSEVASANLDYIASDFLTGMAGSKGIEGLTGKLEQHIATLERMYHVRLKVEAVDVDTLSKIDEDSKKTDAKEKKVAATAGASK